MLVARKSFVRVQLGSHFDYYEDIDQAEIALFSSKILYSSERDFSRRKKIFPLWIFIGFWIIRYLLRFADMR